MATKFPGDELLNVFFKTEEVLDELATKEAGRPIHKDEERVTIRAPGERHMIKVFPATEVWKWVDDPIRGRAPLTYAERFADQYRQFKESHTQTVKGTPLDELPFLTNSKRAELRALGVLTAEALAALAEASIKNLGMGGRELVEKAKAYINNAASSVAVLDLAKEVAALKAENEALRKAVPGDAVSPFNGWEDDDLKNFIKEATGNLPRGNPNHASLVRLADEANDALKKRTEKAA